MIGGARPRILRDRTRAVDFSRRERREESRVFVHFKSNRKQRRAAALKEILLSSFLFILTLLYFEFNRHTLFTSSLNAFRRNNHRN